jgi:hypothetical protein
LEHRNKVRKFSEEIFSSLSTEDREQYLREEELASVTLMNNIKKSKETFKNKNKVRRFYE